MNRTGYKFPDDLIDFVPTKINRFQKYDAKKDDVDIYHGMSIYWPYKLKFLFEITSNDDDDFIFIKDGKNKLLEYLEQNDPNKIKYKMVLPPQFVSAVPERWKKYIYIFKIQDNREAPKEEFIVQANFVVIDEVKSLAGKKIVEMYDFDKVGCSSELFLSLYKLGFYNTYEYEDYCSKKILTPFHYLYIVKLKREIK